MKPGPKRTSDWGLSSCPSQRACALCSTLKEQSGEMRCVRDLYIEGMPLWLLADMFDVPNAVLRAHAWRHNWYRRRSINLPDPRHTLQVAVLARLRASWHLVSPDSADRMLKLLAQLAQDGNVSEAP